MLVSTLICCALAAPQPSAEEAHDFAVSLADAGPRPAGSAPHPPSQGRPPRPLARRVGRGARFELRSPSAKPRAHVERPILEAAKQAHVPVTWVRDSSTGTSDHRELGLAGAPAAKLGIPDEPCRHTACETPDRLSRGAFARVLRVVWPLLRDWS